MCSIHWDDWFRWRSLEGTIQFSFRIISVIPYTILFQLGFESEALRNLKLEDGKTLGDHLALLIGTVGENASIKRAICFKTNHELKLSGYTHPAENTIVPNEITQLGKYGSIVAFRSNEINEELQKNLCQHLCQIYATHFIDYTEELLRLGKAQIGKVRNKILQNNK